MRGPGWARPAAGALVALSLSACIDFSDPPPERGVAPLEIVANNEAATRCSLNRTEVAAGFHEVVVVTGGIDAVVVLRDPSGVVLMEQHGDTWPQPGGGEGAAAPQVPMGPGSYVVTCRYPGGGLGSTRLRVTP